MAVNSLQGLECIGHGVSGIVFAINDRMVIKVPRGGPRGARDQQIESRIYQRLGQHPRIVRYIRSEPRGLVLERLTGPLRKRLRELYAEGKLPSQGLMRKWSRQAIEGLQYLHQRDILQGDIGCHNLLLDKNDDLKYCDLTGSSIDGQEAWVCYETRSQRPYAYASSQDETNIPSEIFALGTTLYEISTTRPPYSDHNEATITEFFQANIFPNVRSLELGNIISKCWRGIYATVDEVSRDSDQLGWDFPKDAIPQRSRNLFSGIWSLGFDCLHFGKEYKRYLISTKSNALH